MQHVHVMCPCLFSHTQEGGRHRHTHKNELDVGERKKNSVHLTRCSPHKHPTFTFTTRTLRHTYTSTYLCPRGSAIDRQHECLGLISSRSSACLILEAGKYKAHSTHTHTHTHTIVSSLPPSLSLWCNHITHLSSAEGHEKKDPMLAL